MTNSNKGRTSLENALVLLFLMITITTILLYFHKYENVVKERAAAEEIYHINSAILIYYVIHGKFPDDLRELVKDRHRIQYRDSFFEKSFLEGSKLDPEGYPLDPWGRRYKYDKSKHLVEMEKK